MRVRFPPPAPPETYLPTFLIIFLAGVFAGGKLAGMDNRQSLAVGCGLNARGILGIVMAAAAYDAELIDLRLFVACVLMCVFTTMAAGPALAAILGRRAVARA